jgi:hypothetical protein
MKTQTVILMALMLGCVSCAHDFPKSKYERVNTFLKNLNALEKVPLVRANVNRDKHLIHDAGHSVIHQEWGTSDVIPIIVIHIKDAELPNYGDCQVALITDGLSKAYSIAIPNSWILSSYTCIEEGQAMMFYNAKGGPVVLQAPYESAPLLYSTTRVPVVQPVVFQKVIDTNPQAIMEVMQKAERRSLN